MIFPIGAVTCAMCIVVGGLIGSAAGERISDNVKNTLNLIFALVALSMGIIPMPGLKNLPAVVLSVILGTLLGVKIKLGNKVRAGLGKLVRAHRRGGEGHSARAGCAGDENTGCQQNGKYFFHVFNLSVSYFFIVCRGIPASRP